MQSSGEKRCARGFDDDTRSGDACKDGRNRAAGSIGKAGDEELRG